MDYIRRKRSYYAKKKMIHKKLWLAAAGAVLALLSFIFIQNEFSRMRRPDERILSLDLPDKYTIAEIDGDRIYFKLVETEVLQDGSSDDRDDIEAKMVFEGGNYRKEEMLGFTYEKNGRKWKLKSVTRKADPAYSFKDSEKASKLAKSVLESKYSSPDAENENFIEDGTTARMIYSGPDEPYYKVRGDVSAAVVFNVGEGKNGKDSVKIDVPVTEKEAYTGWTFEGTFYKNYKDKECFMEITNFDVTESDSQGPLKGTFDVRTDYPPFLKDGEDIFNETVRWKATDDTETGKRYLRSEKNGHPRIKVYRDAFRTGDGIASSFDDMFDDDF